MRTGLLIAAGAFVMAGPALAQEACGKPAAEAVLKLPLPAAPAGVVASLDGCTLFVALPGKGGDGGIAVVLRRDGQASVVRRVAAQGKPGGLALSADGKTLALAAGSSVALYDAARLASGEGDPLIAAAVLQPRANVLAVAFGPAGRLFAADAGSGSIVVLDAKLTRQSSIPAGHWPAGLALSPDGSRLYAVVQFVDGQRADCGPPDGQGSWVAQGELIAIDPGKAAVLSRAVAGCGPARVAADGDTVYVTAQGDNALRAFHAQGLADAGKQEGVDAPVGLAAANGKAFVTSSSSAVHVFGGAGGEIALGGAPLEAAITRDGKTLLITASGPDILAIVDLARLAPKP